MIYHYKSHWCSFFYYEYTLKGYFPNLTIKRNYLKVPNVRLRHHDQQWNDFLSFWNWFTKIVFNCEFWKVIFSTNYFIRQVQIYSFKTTLIFIMRFQSIRIFSVMINTVIILCTILRHARIFLNARLFLLFRLSDHLFTLLILIVKRFFYYKHLIIKIKCFSKLFYANLSVNFDLSFILIG